MQITLKKCCTIGIILLFIGVLISPSINVTIVKASNDNNSKITKIVYPMGRHTARVGPPLEMITRTMNQSYYPSGIINKYCFMLAKTTDAIDWNFFSVGGILLALAEIAVFGNSLGVLPLLSIIFGQVKPLRFSNQIWIEKCQLFTVGQLGNVSYEEIVYVTVRGFTGLKISTGILRGIYVGYATIVSKD